MGKHSIELVPRAAKEIERLNETVQRRVIRQLERLGGDPRPAGCEKLQQNPQFYRVRCGDYRIIYLVDDERALVVVAHIRHRKDAYRGLKKLDAGMLMEMARPHVSTHAISRTSH